MKCYQYIGVNRNRRAILACVLLFVSGSAFAVKNYFEISESEMKILPKFCKTGFKGVPKKEKVWMNHLCPGLNALNHATLSEGRLKKFALERAIAHFNYTLEHKGSPVFHSFTYLKRGKAYELSGNAVKALFDYEHALQLKPKNISVHIALIDVYIKLGDLDNARELVNHGLKIKPNSKSLLRRKEKIN